MPRRSDKVYLGDILDSIALVRSYMADATRTDLIEDLMLRDAVVHRLEVIGEASRQISGAFKAAHPEAAWAEIIGMRNRIVHEYFGINVDRVWDAVTQDLPEFEKLVSAWFAGHPNDL